VASFPLLYYRSTELHYYSKNKVGDRVKTTRRDGIDGLILRGKRKSPSRGASQSSTGGDETHQYQETLTINSGGFVFVG
ncbi:hypothetical protein, partial [Polynucleobacter sp. AP-Latsch-80-C2]|uniref:hypothetical protein n=1 Tax=Polynucleobacter sp. AP-Latsch-80-C2 TaxID=2576931 RepID=UPI001C0DD6BD